MITSKKDYLEYLAADRVALGIPSTTATMLKELISLYPILKFQKQLRKLEYYKNCKKGLLSKFYYFYLQYQFRRRSLELGFTIPENVFGPGLAIIHYGTIVVNSNAKFGKNCRIHASVNIGASGGSPKAPQLGDNIYIGPGTVIFGDIRIGNNVAISANSTVNKTIEGNNILIAGSPAKKIKDFNIKTIIKHA
jgi:serine O-acetyltransferase